METPAKAEEDLSATERTQLPAEEETSAGLVPKRPPGSPPGTTFRGRLRVKPPNLALKPKLQALSQDALEKRALELLNEAVKMSVENTPGSHYPGVKTLPKVQLHSLSKATRDNLLLRARQDIEARLESEQKRTAALEKRLQIQSKLENWYAQKEAAGEAEAERQRKIKEEQDEAEQEARRKWQKRQDMLQKKVADWTIRKAAEEERSKVICPRSESQDRQRMKQYMANQKRRIEEWRKQKEESRRHMVADAQASLKGVVKSETESN